MLRALILLNRRHLLDRPVRTTITVVGIALGVSVSVAIRTANVDVLRSFEEAVTTVAGRATLQVTGGELGLDERLIEVIRSHPDVVAATPVLQASARIARGPYQGASFVIMGLDLLEAGELKDVRVQVTRERGAFLDSLLSPNGIFLGKRLAAEWHLEVGDQLDIVVGTREHRLVLRGIVESEGGLPSIWDRAGVMDIAAAQMLFDVLGRLDRVDVVTAPGRSVEGIATDLKARLPPSVTVNRPSRRNEQVERMVRAFQLNLVTLSGVGLLVGLLLVYNTVSFAVVQRRGQIGILTALGLTRGGISSVFMAEAAVMGLLGGLLGTGLGVLLARSLVGLLGRTISELYVPVPMTAAWDIAFGPLDSLLRVPSSTWLEGGVLGVVVSVLGGLAPSLEASRTAPARALAPGDYEATRAVRSERLSWVGAGLLAMSAGLAIPGPVNGVPLFGYASAFCLLLGLSCLAPGMVSRFDRVLGQACRLLPDHAWAAGRIGVLARLAGDQVARAPGRNAVTISAMMVGIAIMVGVGSMIGSFRHTVTIWIDQTILADLVVAPTSWLQGDESSVLMARIPSSWIESLLSVPGVEAIDPYREMSVEIQGRPVSLVSRDLQLHAGRSRYLFVSGDSGETLKRVAANDEVIVSEVLARMQGIAAGGLLPVMTPAGERAFRVGGVFYDYATDGGKVVMDKSLFRQLWHDETSTVLAVYLSPEADPADVRRRLEKRLGELTGNGVRPVIISNSELKQEILEIFDRTFTVTYALEAIAVVIALLGIINTLLTAVLERRRELATLRSIGTSQRQVRALILLESFYLGLLGGALGVVGGVLLSILLIEVINKQSFGWTIQFKFPISLLVEAVGLSATAALMAGYVPAWWASRQPVAEGLRYE